MAMSRCLNQISLSLSAITINKDTTVVLIKGIEDIDNYSHFHILRHCVIFALRDNVERLRKFITAASNAFLAF